VVQNVAVRLHVVATLDFDGKAIPNSDQRLAHGHDSVAPAFDRDLVADAELPLLDPGHLAS